MNTGRRWRGAGTSVPGPGTYEEIGRVAQGDQVVSMFHTTLTKNLRTTAARTRWGGNPRFRTPGPGTYRPPSDFGYLDFRSTLRQQSPNNKMQNMSQTHASGFNSSQTDAKDALIINQNDSIHSVSVKKSSNNGRNNVSKIITKSDRFFKASSGF